MGKATIRNMKALSLLCCIAILCTIMAVYHAKDEVAELTKNMEDIRIETISSIETLRVSKVEAYFDLEGKEYRVVRLKGSTVGLIKCTIPLSEAKSIEADTTYEAEIKKLSIVDSENTSIATPNKLVDIEFVYDKYIDREISGLAGTSYAEIENSLRQSYIDKVLERRISEISDAMTSILTAYIISMLICYSTDRLLLKQKD